MSEETSFALSEWETLSPETNSELAGLFLEETPECRRVTEALNKSGKIQLTELKSGLRISASSHVGRIRVGNLTITILPKLKVGSLLRLLRYAFGFRRLDLISNSNQLVDQGGFEDLLISQLNAEAQELILRGLQKTYVRKSERLASPRGRVSIDRLALDGGTVTASLPCQHFPRLEDSLINQTLLAGLRHAGTTAGMLELRRTSKRLAAMMEEQVSRIRLDAGTTDRAIRTVNRLSSAYEPALSIIQLLASGRGVVLEGHSTSTAIPGFLFDMNMFFQILISRFLRENLPDCVIRDEHGLKGMMRYNPHFNPRRKTSPTPRPDYAVVRPNGRLSILDAKYRDLWESSLPREMLYQLVVYAFSYSKNPASSILYPAIDSLPKEARIDVNDPILGNKLGQVCLRPVDLMRIEELVTQSSEPVRRERRTLAEYLAFGERHTDKRFPQ